MASTTAARRIPGLCLTAVLLLVPTVLFAENTIGAEYRTFFGLNPRTTVWMVAELHLLFAAFVLGVPIFAVIVEYIGTRSPEARYDRLAHECTALLSAAFATTAALGGLLAFTVFNLYPKVMGHLAGVMHSSFYIYGLLFFGEAFTLYLYYYSWHRMESKVPRHGTVMRVLEKPAMILGMIAIPLFLYLFFFNGVGAFPERVEVVAEAADAAKEYFYAPAHPIYTWFGVVSALFIIVYGIYAWAAGRKSLHIFLGVLLNFFGLTLMLVANSWATYMMSPTGLHPDSLEFIGSTWDAVSNTLWRPLNLHRLLANVVFGGFVIGAYAAVKMLSARSDEARAHYDWMGYIGNFIGISALIPLPFAGYYLGREVYSFSPIMGNDMMGGFFSWTFVLQAVLIGALFMGGNYYLWAGMDRIEGARRYRPYIKFIMGALLLSFMVWVTPHNLPLTPEEQGVMGGQYHPVLKYLGLMPAKNAVVNFILLSTFFSFMLYRRANKGEPVAFSTAAGTGRVVLPVVLGLTLTLVGYFAWSIWNLDPQELAVEADKSVYFRFHSVMLLVHMGLQVLAVVLTFRDRGKVGQAILLGGTALIVTGVFGVSGFFVLEKVSGFLRDLAVCQVLLVVASMVLAQTIDILLFGKAEVVGRMLWGKIGNRPQYALLTLCISVVMLMGLMGYVRSGLRQNWHIYGVLKDTSEQAMSPVIAEMTMTVGVITIIFLALVVFVFWLRSLGETDDVVSEAQTEITG
ncbi:MAG: cytochrome ubiquinol oxidase subunit I [Candidatus Latescibacteria bacterium]|jgi:cytochrome bd-type quinol oxidase subunit 1|nr:hypothetical protein [Gemmatimonadaceae bacterium]MDP6019056.1 cytochrome ubiquinol oxidase subunit I [Candidatus Latescibacterota bacterium]MDP7447845.1 cytochrome ubiquinol oxidase subunit I [Candidatus Latescibacterota bacterium]HJP30561.1 cytochrome ubiquinol oxidase subunit I [Candidatus Latescibacterota bacterium]